MTEPLTINHERVDDIPLLLAQLDRMHALGGQPPDEPRRTVG